MAADAPCVTAASYADCTLILYRTSSRIEVQREIASRGRTHDCRASSAFGRVSMSSWARRQSPVDMLDILMLVELSYISESDGPVARS